MANNLVILGRNEPISFPELAIFDVPAKTDTGAYRSAIHCSDVKLIQSNDKQLLQFTILQGHPNYPFGATMETSDFRVVNVSNSFGHQEDRYEIKLKVKLGPKVFKTTFTLANRSQKDFPILLGRRLLRNRFLVDVRTTGIDRQLLKEKYNIQLPGDEEQKYQEA